VIEIESEPVYWASWVKGARWGQIEHFLRSLAHKSDVIITFQGKNSHFLMEKVHFTVSGEEINVLTFKNKLNSEIKARSNE
jgi:hypothetical protein